MVSLVTNIMRAVSGFVLSHMCLMFIALIGLVVIVNLIILFRIGGYQYSKKHVLFYSILIILLIAFVFKTLVPVIMNNL